jgi:hypothetical protein
LTQGAIVQQTVQKYTAGLVDRQLLLELKFNL